MTTTRRSMLRSLCPLPWLVLGAALFLSCSERVPPPVVIDTENDSCAFCRMAIWSTKTAGQLVAPGHEPKSFDDLGCLAGYLEEHRDIPTGAMAYVVDHHSGEWVRAADALYTRVPGLETPMGSHLVAHASAASREADPVVAGQPALAAREVFAAGSLPGAAR